MKQTKFKTNNRNKCKDVNEIRIPFELAFSEDV